jgi:uncharacterized OsmC-like protein
MSSIGDAIRKATEYLRANPEEARYTDSPATATLDSGLKVTVIGPDGAKVVTDMPTGVGGADSAPSPGWLFRAALASCDATLIAMRAAMTDVELSEIEVTIDSESNDYGILGIDKSVPAGPSSVGTRVKVRGVDADPSSLRELVDWAAAHCPVCDATKRAVPVTLEIDAG